jgi:hypothetical protein
LRDGIESVRSTVLAVEQGMIVGAFVADRWLPATEANFRGRAEAGGAPDRYGFVGREAPKSLHDRYVGKRVPDRFRKPGQANPIQYTWGRARGGNPA